MKLVYLSNSKIPSRSANSIHVMKMCQAFAKSGLDVHLLSSSDIEGKLRSTDPFRFYSVEPVFSIHHIKWPGRFPGKYFLYALFTALKSVMLKADILYGRYLFGVYAAARMGKMVIFESHSDEFTRSSLHRKMIRYLMNSPRCKKFVVISDKLRDAYIDSFPGIQNKIIVAHDGADPKPGVKQSRLQEKFTAGYIGQLYPGKGMEILSRVIPGCPDIQFSIVGGADQDLRRWKKELSDSDHVNFIGFVPHSETDAFLSEMDIVLAPYLSKVHAGSKDGIEIGRWMSPLKIFEYMSAGKAIIASDLPVIREVLQHNKNAILCNPDNPAEWIEAIYLLKNDEELRGRLAACAKKDFEQQYSWDNRAAKILKFIS